MGALHLEHYGADWEIKILYIGAFTNNSSCTVPDICYAYSGNCTHLFTEVKPGEKGFNMPQAMGGRRMINCEPPCGIVNPGS